MSDDDDHSDMDDVDIDLYDHEPSKLEKVEMRKASRTPSEWLRLLCRDWVAENEYLVEAMDVKFLHYKPFLRGMLSSQLLCRLSIPQTREPGVEGPPPPQTTLDFWRLLGVGDEFDRSYIVSQVERFCIMYNIRGGAGTAEEPDSPLGGDLSGADPTTLAAAAAAGISLPSYMDQGATAAAAAAAAVTTDISKLSKKQVSVVSKAQRMAKDAEKALELERRENLKREQRRISLERKEIKAREREAEALRKAAERAAREASREERRKKKLEIRKQREVFAMEQKEAALKRAAELVESNRVPIEITRGAAAAKSLNLPSPSPQAPSAHEPPQRKNRSAIVVSTATDLNLIVTHSKNLFAKYNAIAKEHNQKVTWTTVAKELGIHVKVREKYARMHTRAQQRDFDWEKYGHWKIKDHPEIFLEPTQAEHRARMPPPLRTGSTVLIHGNKEAADEAVAAAAAVVDASVTSPPVDTVVQTTREQTAAAAAVAATLVADPTANFSGSKVENV